MTLCLDIDETLIHGTMIALLSEYKGKIPATNGIGGGSGQAPPPAPQRHPQNGGPSSPKPLEIITTVVGNEVFEIAKRPGLDAFLNYVKDRYEVIAFTAGLEDYAKAVISILDPKREVFRHCLYRHHCSKSTINNEPVFLKDLALLNRPLERLVLVDNCAVCFHRQPTNGIPITSFYDNPNDTALSLLIDFLEGIKSMKDVRPHLREYFKLEEYFRNNNISVNGSTSANTYKSSSSSAAGSGHGKVSSSSHKTTTTTKPSFSAESDNPMFYAREAGTQMEDLVDACVDEEGEDEDEDLFDGYEVDDLPSTMGTVS